LFCERAARIEGWKMIEFKCHACGKFLKLPHSYAGKTTECPGCLTVTRVPGTPPAKPPARAPRSSTPSRQLCVDCGGSFPAGEMLEHNGQAVCTDCYYKRKPVVLKYPKKTSRKRKLLGWLLIVAAAAVAAGAVWYFLAE
jgi:DNA-directed RNA polymerase subunit RPC12/RpoP